jgi:hypothetical protein
VIFSHVLYQLSYLGASRRRDARIAAYRRSRRALSSAGARQFPMRRSGSPQGAIASLRPSICRSRNRNASRRDL